MGRTELEDKYGACLGRIHDLVLDALHARNFYKQWYLEQIFANAAKVLDLGEGEKDWEPGIAP